VQDPEIYLNELGLAFPCIVEPKRPARLDAAHRVLVNHEVYFFSSDETKERFLENPRKWCGLVTDPVTRER
jgi:YHS domain-containing protein